MALDSNHSHSVRRIVLPSGRSIEVVRFTSHANMAEDIERFVTALDAGHILPEDL